jgi:hypothetical protein
MTAPTNDCGCCGGTSVDTPTTKFNRPGLPAIAYRIGTQPEFKASLLARLSSTDYPALAALTTRSDDDWTIAACDACATLGDVLSFYQERIVNESYLRTAVERRSVLELARLIGYQLAPGVAASTAFAFTLESAPGQPALAAQPVTIPVGTRVQSIPDPGQDAQNFETVAAITARVEWTTMPARTSEKIVIAKGLTELYFDGITTQLNPGDAILIVGRERLNDPNSDRWDLRWLDTVETNTTLNLTHVTWSNGLGSAWYPSDPTAHGIHVYAFRARAALWGNSAPDPTLLGITDSTKVSNNDWINKSIDASALRIDLDAVYQKVTKHGWLALAGGATGGSSLTGYIELYRVTAVAHKSQTRYAISGRYTTVTVDSSENLDINTFGLRETSVLAQTDSLTRVPRPLLYPLFGTTLDLQARQPDLQPAQLIAISGQLQRVGFAVDADPSQIVFPDQPTRAPQADDSFQILAPPQLIVSGGTQDLQPVDLDPMPPPDVTPLSGTLLWTVFDYDGSTLKIQAPAGSVELQPALKADDVFSELCAILKDPGGVVTDLDHTTLTLQLPLANCYDRSTVIVNANVAPATHGESVAEIGGNGDAGQTDQVFTLKQAPLTYVSSSTDPSGRSATLLARINGIQWTEVDTLYGTAPTDRVYTLRQDDDGTTTVAFGDGVNGARLPSGQNNVRFSYRKGIGVAGNLRNGQLTTLLTRPLGVKAATNPTPATGGQDPETLDDARGNAPLRVLTLDRAVSIDDYADYSRAFAGIAKSYAIWIDDPRARGVYITVGGPDGEQFPATSTTLADLIAALRNYGDALLPLSVQSYTNATFTLQATLKVDPAYDNDAVIAAVTSALRAAYSFDARDFGQSVTIDEVYAVMQNVAGVIAVDISQLYRLDSGPIAPQPGARLLAALPTVQADGSVNAAELLTLDAGPVTLGVMP